jgi:quercetin dioxygenase-like cupin family protein
VTVLRILIPPHAIVPEHDVSPRVVVWLTDAHLRLTFPDGAVREERYHAGQTSWVTPERHTGENLEAQPIEFIAIIPKSDGKRGESRRTPGRT